MAVLIQNGEIYSPEYCGKQDVLIIGSKVVCIDETIDAGAVAKLLPDVEVVDAAGKWVMPGLIDQHVHLIGGGGEMGFATRTPEVVLSKVIEAGVTTVAGLLGTDGHARNVETLYAKAKGLEEEGITTLIYTGSYKLPTVTLTGSVARDIMFIDKVIGVKMALSDHRSSHFTFDELTRLASEVRVAGMLGGKPGIVHIHMGGGKSGLDLVFKAVAETDIPITQFLPTHVTRTEMLFDQARLFAKMGGRIDITSFGEMHGTGRLKPSSAVAECIKDGVPLENVTVSSDGNGSVPRYDEQGNICGMGVGLLNTSLQTLKNLVFVEGLDVSTALRFFTTNPAKILGIYPAKGMICCGGDGDIVIMDKGLNLEAVFAKGRKMMDGGKVIARGTFEVS